MGIYTERKIGAGTGLVVLAAAFAALYGVWLFGGPELARDEVLYATAAAEFSPDNPVATIHGWATPGVFPLFPLAASLLRRFAGIPMESALRGLSVLMLGAGTVLVYIASSSRRSHTAGFVAAAMYSTSMLALEKAVEGDPATGNAFWLLVAQLAFFQYGVRKSDWNRAWIYSALLLALGFLSGGFSVLLFFAFPMFFFRRPLSVKSKFRKPGFAAALAIVAMTVLAWGALYISSPRQISFYDLWWRELAAPDYLREFFVFPFELGFRLLPWSFIAWLPFCVALQSLDTTPIFSRYLRTLVFSTLALLWLMPEWDRRSLFYLLGPLSVLTGDFYEIGVRRYGAKLRRSFVLADLFVLSVPLLIAIGCFAPEHWLAAFVSLGQTLAFRNHPDFMIAAAAVLAPALLLAFYVHQLRRSEPVWMILLAVSVSAAVFFNGMMFPYRSQERRKSAFGSDIRRALNGASAPVEVLYTLNVRDLNGGLFYTGIPVRKLAAAEELPRDDKAVYLLCAEFPQSAERSWSNLLPQDYAYNGHPLALWKGVLRQSSRPPAEPDGEAPSVPSGSTGVKE